MVCPGQRKGWSLERSLVFTVHCSEPEPEKQLPYLQPSVGPFSAACSLLPHRARTSKEIRVPLPLSAGIKGLRHHPPAQRTLTKLNLVLKSKKHRGVLSTSNSTATRPGLLSLNMAPVYSRRELLGFQFSCLSESLSPPCPDRLSLL